MGIFLSTSPRQQREGFNPSVVNSPPLSGQEASNCLLAAERIDGYRSKVNKSPVNLKARAGQKYVATNDIVKVAIPPADTSLPWWSGQVLWMDPTADNGLPHTRPPGYICLPASLKDGPVFLMTLLHERIHLHQRRYPDIWSTLFNRLWNMKEWDGKLPDKLEQNRRLNPDLLPVPFYIWKDTWVPYASFNDPVNPDLNHAPTVWYNVQQGTISKIPPMGWTEYFGKITNDEHPWEIAAYYLSDPKINCKAKTDLQLHIKEIPKSY
jgi:hypothetical protein